MTGALTWLNEIAQWIASWIPRLLIVLHTERAVRFRHGSQIFVLEPGLHVYWPIVTRIQKVNVMRSVQNLSTQMLTTLDGITMIVSGVLVYRVNDIERFLVANHDAEAGIDEVACAAIRQVMLSLSVDDIHAASIGGGLNDRLRRETRKSLASFGIHVEYCRLTDCAPAQIFSLAGIPSELHITQYQAKVNQNDGE